jgi:hypothetical protein
MILRSLLPAAIVGVVLLNSCVTASAPQTAQTRAQLPLVQPSYFEASKLKAFYSTYRYTAYTVYDLTTDEAPTRVDGVGGTLQFRPDGSYEKRLTISRPNGTMSFNQDGRFTIKGDSISFAFTDNKGADVQRGTFRFDPQTQALTITILGYPTGNKGVYELTAQPGK